MGRKNLSSYVMASLEFGPIAAFVVAYLVFRNELFVVSGREYSGLVAVTAAFLPIFAFSFLAVWILTGRITRLHAVTTAMLLVFGGLGLWMNDPAVIKMKPTAIYLLLATLLGIGLLRGQSWLQFILEDMVPLQHTGWMILTKRTFAVFLLSAAANELVWRTQSDTVWVIFETLVMPLLIVGFCLTQIGVIIEHVTWPPPKSGKAKGKARRSSNAPKAPRVS